jgi:hypothetical protein
VGAVEFTPRFGLGTRRPFFEVKSVSDTRRIKGFRRNGGPELHTALLHTTTAVLEWTVVVDQLTWALEQLAVATDRPTTPEGAVIANATDRVHAARETVLRDRSAGVGTPSWIVELADRDLT